jgi:uncharacterized protein YjdB
VYVGRLIFSNLAASAAVLGLLVVGGCKVGGATLVDPSAAQSVSANPTPVASAITVSASSSSVTVHSTVSLQATAVDAKGNAVTGTAFTWTSSAPPVATVSATGVVTGMTAGSTNITARSGSLTSNTFPIAVVDAPVASVTVTITGGPPKVATFKTLQAQAVAKDASGDVLTRAAFTWTSSKPAVATVNGNGLITGVAAGTVAISASSGGVTSSALSVMVTSHP